MKPLYLVDEERYPNAVQFYKRNKEETRKEFDIPEGKKIETLDELWEETGEMADAELIRQVVENQYLGDKPFSVECDENTNWLILKIYTT